MAGPRRDSQKLDALLERPIVKIKPERMKEYDEYFATKCKKNRGK